jgi:hypothetical protein
VKPHISGVVILGKCEKCGKSESTLIQRAELPAELRGLSPNELGEHIAHIFCKECAPFEVPGTIRVDGDKLRLQ